MVEVCSAELGIENIDEFRDALDLLPRRAHREWNSAGTIVASTKARSRPQCPTLYPEDLTRIVAEAGNSVTYRAVRDRAVVALHCYSGARVDELVALRRSQIGIDETHSRVLLEVWRSGQVLRIPVPAPGAAPLLELLRHLPSAGLDAPGYVFRRAVGRDVPLTRQAIRAVIRSCCDAAGFPRATSHDLHAALAYSLRAHGLSDHETARILGLKQVRSLDRLLARHRALDAQRQVGEVSISSLSLV